MQKRVNCMFLCMVMMLILITGTGCDMREDLDNSDGGSGVVTIKKQDAEKEKKIRLADAYPQIDGRGILWKPVSEGNRMLVVLLDGSYGAPGVSVLDADLNVIETGSYVGATNGGRGTYRFRRTGGDFPSPAIIQVGGTLLLVDPTHRRHE